MEWVDQPGRRIDHYQPILFVGRLGSILFALVDEFERS